jgi:hypothetical protein
MERLLRELQTTQRRKILDPSGEAERDATGLVSKLLTLCGGEHLPIVAGYRLGPARYTGFAEPVHKRLATADDGVMLLPSRRGVDAMYVGRKQLYAPSIESALERLLARDRAARGGYTFRVHAPVGAALAELLACLPQPEWPGCYLGERAVIDEVGRRTDIDCVSMDAAQRLIEAAVAQKLPLVLREDSPPAYRAIPSDGDSFVVTLAPHDAFGRLREPDGWDGPAAIKLEVRGSAIVQTRIAFGAPIDERVAFPGGTAWSGALDRALGSARVTDYLVRQRAARVAELASAEGMKDVLAARGLADFSSVCEVESRLGGLVGAGTWGGAGGLLILPRMLLGAGARAFGGELPRTLREAQPVAKLGDSDVEGLLCGWLNPYDVLFIDRRGWLYTVDDNGDEHERSSTLTTLLEKLALRELVVSRCEASVVIDADIAIELAERLGLLRVNEASDEISAVFMRGEAAPPLLAIERRRFWRIDGAPMRAFIWAETRELLADAAHAARRLAPGVSFLSSDGYQATGERLDFLRRNS